MKVVVLMGGRSAEREISLKTGQAILEALRELGHEALALDLDDSLCEKLKQIKPDKVFIALHGPYGEDGRIQGFLDILGITYVGSGVLGSALAMDKDITKKLLRFHGLPTPDWISVKHGEGFIWDRFPAVVKPSDQGSSVGLYVVNNKSELEYALKKLWNITQKAIVEEFIEGRDITVGILKEEALPPIEIKPKKGIYDYESKYTKGMSEYEFLEEPELERKLQRLALQAHNILELRDMSRVDFRVNKHGQPFILEINTIPGMTELSLFPMACRKKGIDFKLMLSMLIC